MSKTAPPADLPGRIIDEAEILKRADEDPNLRGRARQIFECDTCGQLKVCRLDQYRKCEKHYCSRQCYWTGRRTSVEGKCDGCGKSIQTFQSSLKRHKHHYCSIECAGKADTFNVTVKCAVCGAEKTKKYSNIKNSQNHYCSRKCARIGSQNRVLAVCSSCGKSVELPEFRLKKSKGNIYCSKACWNVRSHKIFDCDVCGKKAKQCLSSYSHSTKHYCSKECANIGQTKIRTCEIHGNVTCSCPQPRNHELCITHGVRRERCKKCGTYKKLLKAGFTIKEVREMGRVEQCQFPGCAVRASDRKHGLSSDHVHDGNPINPENYRGEICHGCNVRLADLDAGSPANALELLYIMRRPYSRFKCDIAA
jgi:hypothetical protein